MDSFEINKIMGAVLATLLGLMIVHIGANTYFAPRVPEKPGYEIAVAEPEDKPGAPAAPKEEPLAQRIAAADAGRGKAVFKRCAACHTVEQGGPNRVGPNLYGVIGRAFAAVPGFNYSAAMQKHGGEWTPEEFDEFMRAPKQTIPGTSMIFAGIARGSDRADLLAFLNQQSDKPIDLPKEAPKEAPKEEAKDEAKDDPAKDAPAKPEQAKPEPAPEKAGDDKPAPAPETDKPAPGETPQKQDTQATPADKPGGDAGAPKPPAEATDETAK